MCKYKGGWRAFPNMSKAHEEDLVCISQIIMIPPRIKNTFCVRVFGFWKTFPKYCNPPRERLDSPFSYYLGTKSCKSIILDERRHAVTRSSLCPCHCKSISIKHDRSFLQKEERLNKTGVFWKRPNKRVKNIFLTRTSSHFFFLKNVWNISWRRLFLFDARSIRKSFFSPPSSLCVRLEAHKSLFTGRLDDALPRCV